MQHVDVIIVGAGLSGIGAAVHLTQHCKGKTFTILEGRDAIGGTWDLFRYPGIRSDSDMHTLGYSFKPWTQAKAIADGPNIREYVNNTADEHNIRQHIKFNHKVTSAAWSTEDSRWVVTCDNGGNEVQISGNLISMCGGYYNYDQAYRPEFKDQDKFSGTILHPQFWPEDLDYTGKKVVVIGSGATAMTLVPAMAKEGAHVTMVQRSPTYVVSRPAEDKIANTLRKFLPESWAYAVTRFKNIKLGNYFYNQTRTNPEKVKARILGMLKEQLGEEMVKDHFTPTYNPWDQRMCLIPDADLYQCIKNGSAEVVTAHIDGFTENGLKLDDGTELEADIIVTATGLELIVASGVEFTVDDKKIDFPDTWSYKGMMFSGMPNLVQTFGYINASWTLRADLVAEYVCKLINRMDELGVKQVTPTVSAAHANMEARPWIDDFSPGYMKRVMHLFPKQGDGSWRNTQNYALDKKMIHEQPIDDSELIFSNPPAAQAPTQQQEEKSAA